MRPEWLVDYGRYLVAAVGTAGTYLFGGWDAVLVALVWLVVIDYLTGVLAAWSRKELSSEVGALGIAKKLGLFLLVAVANLLDGVGGFGDPVLRTAVVIFLIANEALSIIENLGDIGVPIPDSLREAIERLKGKSTGGGLA